MGYFRFIQNFIEKPKLKKSGIIFFVQISVNDTVVLLTYPSSKLGSVSLNCIPP